MDAGHARVNTADDPSTSDTNLVNNLRVFALGGLHAGLCHAFLVCIYLSRTMVGPKRIQLPVSSFSTHTPSPVT